MILKVEKSGVTYEFEVGENFIIGEQIKGEYEGYSIKHECSCYTSYLKLYLKGKEPRNIGRLEYVKNKSIPDDDNKNNGIVYYKKFGFRQDRHELHVMNCIGLCWDVVSKMRPIDIIVIQESIEGGSNYYSISVRKLMKFEGFKHFKMQGYEKQIFVPNEEFKKKFVPIEKKGDNVYDFSKKRKRTNKK